MSDGLGRTPSAIVAVAIGRAGAEIMADVEAGRVPRDVGSFAELHDYVDANEYGGLCEPRTFATLNPYANLIQDALDAWIKNGGLR